MQPLTAGRMESGDHNRLPSPPAPIFCSFLRAEVVRETGKNTKRSLWTELQISHLSSFPKPSSKPVDPGREDHLSPTDRQIRGNIPSTKRLQVNQVRSHLGEAVEIFTHLPRLWTKVHRPAPAAQTHLPPGQPGFFLLLRLYTQSHVALDRTTPPQGLCSCCPVCHSRLSTNVPSPWKTSPPPRPCLVLLQRPVSSLGSPARTVSVCVLVDLWPTLPPSVVSPVTTGTCLACLLWDPAAQGQPVELLSEYVRQTEPSSPGRELGLLLVPGLEHHFFGPLWRSLSLQSD